MSDDTYNGWTNYETWNVNLWLANDEPMYRKVRGIVIRETVDGDDASTHRIAEDIEAYVLTCAADGEGGFRFGDLKDFSELKRVNWQEIAETWMEE